MNTLQFLGPWDPTSGAFPILPSNVASAYYFVSEAGEFNSFTFEVGNWLLFIEDSAGNGTWYQTSGGVIQIVLSQSDDRHHHHSFVHGPTEIVGEEIGGVTLPNLQVEIKQALGTLFTNPSADAVVFTYDAVNNVVTATVKHDDTLNIDTAGRLQVVGGTGGTTPIGEITPADITGFDAAVLAAIGPSLFTSPPSAAVQFTFNNQNNSVSADVKIDGVTITKNNYGQLVAHFSEVVTPAPQQIIGLPSSNTYSDGAVDLQNMDIVDAVASLNRLIKTMEEALSVATAAPPLNLGDYSLTFGGTTVSAKAVSDGSAVDVYIDNPPIPQIGPFLRPDAPGPLAVFVDSDITGTITIDSSDLTGHVNGDLTIVSDTDFYQNIPYYFGRYKVMTALVTLLGALTEGNHEVILTNSSGQSTANAFSFADTNVSGTIDEESSTIITFGAMEFLSGVPVLSTPNVLIGPLVIDNVAKVFYEGTDVLELASPSLHFDVATPPAVPSAGDFTQLETNSLSGTIPGSFFSTVSLDFTIYTLGHRAVGTQNFTFDKRWDASVDLETPGNAIARILSGSTDFDFTGGAYDSSVSLVGIDELQIENNFIKFPTANYATLSGPDYSGIAQGSTWRYCTLVQSAGPSSGVSHVDLDLSHLTTLTSNPLKIFIKIGTSPVVDANAVYNPSNPWQDGVPGWDQTVTSLPAGVRRINFGSNVVSGALSIKIGMKGPDAVVGVPVTWLAS